MCIECHLNHTIYVVIEAAILIFCYAQKLSFPFFFLFYPSLLLTFFSLDFLSVVFFSLLVLAIF